MYFIRKKHALLNKKLKRKQKKYVWGSWYVSVLGGFLLKEDLREMNFGAMNCNFSYFRINKTYETNDIISLMCVDHAYILKKKLDLFWTPFIFEYTCIFALICVDHKNTFLPLFTKKNTSGFVFLINKLRGKNISYSINTRGYHDLQDIVLYVLTTGI